MTGLRVLLVAANTERITMPTPPLGLAYVASAARERGHEVRVLDLMGEPEPRRAVAEAVQRCDPQVLAISVRNIDDQCMQRPEFLVEKVRPVVEVCRRASRAALVVGGAGYSIFPDAALSYLGADLGIQGEAEEAFPTLLDVLAAGDDPLSVARVHASGGRGSDADATPVDLDRHPYPVQQLKACGALEDPELWAPVQTRRGCALHCVYCSTPRIEGRRLRLRSLDGVMDDLASLVAAGVGRIYFVDNTFNLPPSYALALCRRMSLARLGVQWRAIVYPGRLTDELAHAMAEAGCVEVALGFESGCDEMLRALGKPFAVRDVRRVSDTLAAVGVRRAGFLLVGGPGETEDTVRRSLEAVADLRLDSVKLTTGIRLYPGTSLAVRAVAEGAVAADDDLLRPTFYLAPGLEALRVEELASAFLG